MLSVSARFRSALSGPPSCVPAQTQAVQDSWGEERVLDPSTGPMMHIPNDLRANQNHDQRHADRLIRHVPLSSGANVAWGSAGFCVSLGKEVKLYTPPGEVAAHVFFGPPVFITLCSGESLPIEMSVRRFICNTESLA